MSKRDYGKIGAGFGAIAVIVALVGVIQIANLTDTLRYFYFTLVLLFGMFVYFEFFKEYKIKRT